MGIHLWLVRCPACHYLQTQNIRRPRAALLMTWNQHPCRNLLFKLLNCSVKVLLLRFDLIQLPLLRSFLTGLDTHWCVWLQKSKDILLTSPNMYVHHFPHLCRFVWVLHPRHWCINVWNFAFFIFRHFIFQSSVNLALDAFSLLNVFVSLCQWRRR